MTFCSVDFGFFPTRNMSSLLISTALLDLRRELFIFHPSYELNWASISSQPCKNNNNKKKNPQKKETVNDSELIYSMCVLTWPKTVRLGLRYFWKADILQMAIMYQLVLGKLVYYYYFFPPFRSFLKNFLFVCLFYLDVSRVS